MQPRAAQSRHQCTHVLHGAHQALRKGEQRGRMVGVRLRHIGGQQEALGSAIQLEDLGAGTSEGQGAGFDRPLDEGSQRFRVRNGAHALQRCGLRTRRPCGGKSHPPRCKLMRSGLLSPRAAPPCRPARDRSGAARQRGASAAGWTGRHRCETCVGRRLGCEERRVEAGAVGRCREEGSKQAAGAEVWRCPVGQLGSCSGEAGSPQPARSPAD